MGKSKQLIYFEEQIFIPLLRYKSNPKIQFGTVKTKKDKIEFVIKIGTYFTKNQIYQFLKEEGSKIKQLMAISKLPPNPLKVGPEQKVPSVDVYALKEKWRWSWDKIEQYFSIHPTTKWFIEVNKQSLIQAYQREKKRRKAQLTK